MAEGHPGYIESIPSREEQMLFITILAPGTPYNATLGNGSGAAINLNAQTGWPHQRRQGVFIHNPAVSTGNILVCHSDPGGTDDEDILHQLVPGETVRINVKPDSAIWVYGTDATTKICATEVV